MTHLPFKSYNNCIRPAFFLTSSDQRSEGDSYLFIAEAVSYDFSGTGHTSNSKHLSYFYGLFQEHTSVGTPSGHRMILEIMMHQPPIVHGFWICTSNSTITSQGAERTKNNNSEKKVTVNKCIVCIEKLYMLLNQLSVLKRRIRPQLLFQLDWHKAITHSGSRIIPPDTHQSNAGSFINEIINGTQNLRVVCSTEGCWYFTLLFSRFVNI